MVKLLPIFCYFANFVIASFLDISAYQRFESLTTCQCYKLRHHFLWSDVNILSAIKMLKQLTQPVEPQLNNQAFLRNSMLA